MNLRPENLYQGKVTMRFVCLLLLFIPVSIAAKDFLDFPRTDHVIDILVNEHGLDRDIVRDWMADGKYREAPVRTIAAPAESTKTYAEYKPMFVAPDIIRNGRKFARSHQDLLVKAEQQYGVPQEIIVSIIGIETKYGRSRGRHNTFDSLGSLAVTEGRRADYFRREWIKFILISLDQGMDPLDMKGSYAGATGYPQFMPTSYEAYAVDHDGDGDINIWSDTYDAIGSVANYLRENGWRPGELIVSAVTVSGDFASVKQNSFDRDRTLAEVEAAGWQPVLRQNDDDLVFPIRLDGEQGTEYWLGYKNFWAISRYNRSTAYSMAVFQLAEAIASEQ